MRLELRYFVISVVLLGSIFIEGSPRHALASERSSGRDSSLILRLDSVESTSQDTLVISKESETQTSKAASLNSSTSTTDFPIPRIDNPLPVDPWFPGRGSIGVKLEVNW